MPLKRFPQIYINTTTTTTTTIGRLLLLNPTLKFACTVFVLYVLTVVKLSRVV